MSLRSVNLNLVPILRALLREQHVSRAAETLGLTQPAVSAALGRLREILKDPLLVQVGRGMEITPRARALIKPVEEACEALDGLWSDPIFDPATTTRCFVIVTTDYAPILMAPALMTVLAQRAPGISMHFLDLPLDEVLKNRSGGIDFVISARAGLEALGATDIHIDDLFRDDFVFVVGPQHRLSEQAAIVPQDYADERYVMFDPGVEQYGAALRAQFERNFPAGRIHTRVGHFSVLRLLATLTDCVALVPRRLATIQNGFSPVRILGQPAHPIEVEMCLAWSPRYEFDLAHRWFRQLLRETVGGETVQPASDYATSTNTTSASSAAVTRKIASSSTAAPSRAPTRTPLTSTTPKAGTR